MGRWLRYSHFLFPVLLHYFQVTAWALLITPTSLSKPLSSIELEKLLEALNFGHGLSILSLPLYHSLVQSLQPTDVLHSLQTIIGGFEEEVFRPPTNLFFFYYFLLFSI